MNTIPENELKKREALRLSNQESNKLTKDCIRTALLMLMGENAYDKITITDIIRRSGVSRAGFYRNYNSKDDVVKEFIEDIKTGLTMSMQDFDKDPRAWFLKCFEILRASEREVRILLDARQPLSFLPSGPDYSAISQDEGAEHFYFQLATHASLAAIITGWFERGMIESDAEMADICCKVVNFLG